MEPSENHRTVRLGRGKHRGPGDVVCVMELASMVAGEPFSDRPRCACPIIGALLREYNDHVDDGLRQQLHRYAPLVVGSRSSAAVQARRAQLIMSWAAARDQRRPRWLRRIWPARLDSRVEVLDAYARHAIRTLPRVIYPALHEEVLELIDELLAIGPEETAGRAPASPHHVAAGRDCASPAARRRTASRHRPVPASVLTGTAAMDRTDRRSLDRVVHPPAHGVAGRRRERHARRGASVAG